MTRLNVRPTRVELRNLQKRKQIAVRGHALLKEKQDALVARFLKLMEEAREKRKILDVEISTVFQHYQYASLLNDDEVLQNVLNTHQQKLEINLQLSSILGLHVPKITAQPDLDETPANFTGSGFLALRDLDAISGQQKELQRQLLATAQIEKQCQIMAHEIILTKRRVNSLEYRTIPDLTETIGYIAMKIEDNERQQTAKLINMEKKRS